MVHWLTIAIVFELILYLDGHFKSVVYNHEYWSKIPYPPCILTRFSWANSHNYTKSAQKLQLLLATVSWQLLTPMQFSRIIPGTYVLYPIDRIYLRFELQLMHTSKTTDRFSIELTKQGHYTHNIFAIKLVLKIHCKKKSGNLQKQV